MIQYAQKIYRTLIALSLLLSLTTGLQAKVLDNFDDNIKKDWTDFTFIPGVGLPVETGGQFKFTLPPIGQSIFVASTKSSQTFTVEDGKTIEFRVDLVYGKGKDSFAILAFIPKSSSASSLGGYGFAKSTTDILVTKGIGKYFYAQNPPEPLKNENVTMVLSLTGQGANVLINTKLLDKDDGNKVIFEQTFLDTPAADVLSNGADSPAAPWSGVGNFVLFCYEDFDKNAPQDSYEVVFDNAETYVVENTILDDFDDNSKQNWSDFTFIRGFGLPTESNGQFNFNLPPAGQALFVASTKTSKTYTVAEGEKVEFSVDLVEGNGKDSFAILAFIPTTSSASSLSGYGLAKSTTDILITKGIGKYFYADNPDQSILNSNVILKLTLIGKDGNVHINGQVIDKSNGAILFDKTFIDTPAADVLMDGADSPAAPFLGAGNFVLYCYEDYDKNAPNDVYTVIYDNARVSAPPVVANTAPIISEVLPATSSAFLPAASLISFKISDDQTLVNDKISVVLNGTTYTTANGLTVTGTGGTRTATLGGLVGNTSYIAVAKVTDSENANTAVTTYFDTFDESSLVVEIEDFNFAYGQFFDNPSPIAENTGPATGSYPNQIGTLDVDYSDTRGDFRDALYRPEDHVRMQHSLDVPRAKYVAAGGSAATVYDYDVGDVVANEWLNYTRTFTAGSYQVYLRESVVNIPQVQADLELVTSDPRQFEQTVKKLGSFSASTSGYQFRNIPLTDALGQNKVILRLAGTTTLRFRQASSEPGDGAIYQNYLIFIPVADPGLERPTVESVSPLAGSVVTTVGPLISALILNRDTTVKAGSVVLSVNGNAVTATVKHSQSSTMVSYNLPINTPTAAPVTVSLVYQDNLNVAQTSSWSFTLDYQVLSESKRVAGTGAEPGFNARLVQAPLGSGLENSLQRADAQLAANSSIPVFVSNKFTADVLNFSDRTETDQGYFARDLMVPGLDPDVNGGDNFAVEMSAYLYFPAGVHRLGVRSDDGYKFTVGTSLTDNTTLPLAFHNGGPADERFEFVVNQSGLYPVRMVWYEAGGAAHFELYSEDRVSGERVLVNDEFVASSIKAYRSIAGLPAQVEAFTSSNVGGPYTQDSAAIVDSAAGTVTLAADADVKFIRLRLSNAPGTITLKSTQTTPQGKVVLSYQLTN